MGPGNPHPVRPRALAARLLPGRGCSKRLAAIDGPPSVTNLLAVHALSGPYLLVCASIGVVLSVLVSREDFAQRSGIAVIFLLFVVDAVSIDTDYEWLGDLSPTRYCDPTEILVEGTYDVEDALSCSPRRSPSRSRTRRAFAE